MSEHVVVARGAAPILYDKTDRTHDSVEACEQVPVRICIIGKCRIKPLGPIVQACHDEQKPKP